MKKLLLFIFLDIVILAGLYFGAPTFKKVAPLSEPIGAYEDFINGIIGKESSEGEDIVEEEPLEEVQEPIEEEPEIEEETVEEEESEEEVIDEIIEDEPMEDELVSGPAPTLVDLDFYSDERVNFTYPTEFEVVLVSELALELRTREGLLLATMDFYVNDSNLSVTEFVKQDNIVDFVTEAERVNIDIENLSVAEEAMYLKDFPGFITQDVYLVRIPNYVLVVQARNQKEAIRKFVVPTLEAR